MALSYSPVDIRGLAPILEQVFSQIKLFQMVMLLSMTTLSKHNFTEAGVSVTAQLYTCISQSRFIKCYW
jgi:hypothetical protein